MRPNPLLSWDAQFLPVLQPGQWTSDSFDNVVQFDAGVGYLFERGGKRDRRIDAARDQTVLTQAQISDAERVLTFAVSQQFVGVLLARSNVRFAEDALGNYQRTVRLNEERQRAGDISESDLLKIKIQLLQCRGRAGIPEAGRPFGGSGDRRAAGTARLAGSPVRGERGAEPGEAGQSQRNAGRQRHAHGPCGLRVRVGRPDASDPRWRATESDSLCTHPWHGAPSEERLGCRHVKPAGPWTIRFGEFDDGAPVARLFQERERRAKDVMVPGDVVGSTERPPKQVPRDDDARQQHPFRRVTEGPDLNDDGRGAGFFQCPCDVSDGHVADGSNGHEHDGIDPALLHERRPLGAALVDDPSLCRRPDERVRLGRQFADDAGFR